MVFRRRQDANHYHTALVVRGLLAGSASANTFNFGTSSSAKDASGDPVEATASFVTSANQLSITLTDLQANPKDVGQLLSDLSFGVLIGNTGTASLTSGTGVERTLHGNGSYADGSTVATGGVLSNPTSGTLLLNVLSGAGHAGPAHLIIGPPNGSGNYSAANGSIAGNGPHNPFLANSATFILDIPGMSVDSTINNIMFSFGTTAGDNVPGIKLVADGGATVLLLGAAISGLGFLRRKMR